MALDKNLTVEDIARFSDTSPQEVKTALGEESPLKFNYRVLNDDEQNRVTSKIHDELKQSTLAVSGENDSSRWESGWAEILRLMKTNNFEPELLKPQYFKHDILRLNRKFIQVSDIDFEYNLFTLLRKIIFKKYLSQYSKILEFGCGTGSNLYVLRNLFPQASLIGCDWVKSSLKILEIISQNVSKKIEGAQFNMLNLEGKENISLDQQTAVVKIHSMEQLANSFSPLLNYILSKKPGIVFHLEPILELYDPQNTLDNLAIKWHKKRNYLNGYLPKLEELEKNKSIKIIQKHRFYFGSMFHEAYSLTIWKPEL